MILAFLSLFSCVLGDPAPGFVRLSLGSGASPFSSVEYQFQQVGGAVVVCSHKEQAPVDRDLVRCGTLSAERFQRLANDLKTLNVTPNPDRKGGGGRPNPDRKGGGAASAASPNPDRKGGGGRPNPDRKGGGAAAAANPNPDRKGGGGPVPSGPLSSLWLLEASVPEAGLDLRVEGEVLNPGTPFARAAFLVAQEAGEALGHELFKDAFAAEAKTGVVSIWTRPRARLYIDGVDYQRLTPMLGIVLPVGTHRVVFVREESGLRRSGTVEVKAGRNTNYFLELEPKAPAPKVKP